MFPTGCPRPIMGPARLGSMRRLSSTSRSRRSDSQTITQGLGRAEAARRAGALAVAGRGSAGGTVIEGCRLPRYPARRSGRIGADRKTGKCFGVAGGTDDAAGVGLGPDVEVIGGRPAQDRLRWASVRGPACANRVLHEDSAACADSSDLPQGMSPFFHIVFPWRHRKKTICNSVYDLLVITLSRDGSHRSRAPECVSPREAG
jgi:hypothetical protein